MKKSQREAERVKKEEKQPKTVRKHNGKSKETKQNKEKHLKKWPQLLYSSNSCENVLLCSVLMYFSLIEYIQFLMNTKLNETCNKSISVHQVVSYKKY